jgi:hypothetical protein
MAAQAAIFYGIERVAPGHDANSTLSVIAVAPGRPTLT